MVLDFLELLLAWSSAAVEIADAGGLVAMAVAPSSIDRLILLWDAVAGAKLQEPVD